MSRRGFTLVEILIVALLASVVLGTAWFMFVSGSRQSVRLDQQLRRVQALVLLLEELSNDVAQAVRVPEASEAGNRAGGPELTLYRFKAYRVADEAAGPTSEATHAVRSEAVVYRFDPSSRRLLRNGLPLPLGTFQDLRFYPPDTFTPGVKLTVVAAPEGSRSAGQESVPTLMEYDFVLPLRGRSEASAFDCWQENYYDLEPALE